MLHVILLFFNCLVSSQGISNFFLYNRPKGKTLKKNNQKVLLIGGTRGIGRVIRQQYSARGVPLVYTGRAPEARSRLQGAASETYLCLDLLDNRSIEGFLQQAEVFGPFTALYFVAGLSSRTSLEEMSLAGADRLVGTNFSGPAKVCGALGRLMCPGGRVVFANTLAALRAFPLVGLYGAAKSALSLLAQTVEAENGPLGLSAGVVYLDFVQNDPDKQVLGPGGEMASHQRKAQLSQDQAAALMIKAGASKSRRVFSTLRGAFLDWMQRHFPRLTHWLMSRKQQGFHQGHIPRQTKRTSRGEGITPELDHE
jgi:NAD(P)-dependent dehydrogenase (short-subunit alcohol dehydrogenase family)